MRTAAFLLLSVCLASISLAAQSPPTDNEPLDLKSYSCAEHLDLVDIEDGRSDIVTVWAHGYYNGMLGVDEKSAPASWITVEEFSERLLKVCQQDPKKLFITAVKQTAEAKQTAQAKQTARSATVERTTAAWVEPVARSRQTAPLDGKLPSKQTARLGEIAGARPASAAIGNPHARP